MDVVEADVCRCPICGRDRQAVAESHRTGRGVQIAIGPRRTSCVECGVKVLEKRDARRNARFRIHDTAEAKFKALMSQCQKLAALRSEMQDEVSSAERRLNTLRQLSLVQRLRFVLFGHLPQSR